MASFTNNFSLILLFFMMSSALMFHTGFFNEDYLTNCASNLDTFCGKDVYFAIFFGNTTVNEDCCDELVSGVGKVCHDDMTKYVLTKLNFKNNYVQILERSQKIWNDCVAIE
ncbi:hypothetical protein PHAVU_001G065900 [Phaseolus vulgaris]|uniref:Prolamin-like domain-containing protein n=1 Tax=Phaseolus vulgaris TaxID=3885 RepID=V7CTD5_PHAVU|nr:hypothetical protein PHAVU_001G065900g [Phaseolus vulgaris]ESW33399.1 hypothetical protein PHAVU_001G065900g [Phaseolus vulgaris]